MADPLELSIDLPDLPVLVLEAPDIHHSTVLVELPEIPVLGLPEPVSTDVVVVPVIGPPGKPGQSGGTHEHVQTVPSTVWTITHGLGRRLVGVQVFSLGYDIQWEGVIVQPLDDSTVRLSFDDPTSGVALIL